MITGRWRLMKTWPAGARDVWAKDNGERAEWAQQWILESQAACNELRDRSFPDVCKYIKWSWEAAHNPDVRMPKHFPLQHRIVGSPLPFETHPDEKERKPFGWLTYPEGSRKLEIGECRNPVDCCNYNKRFGGKCAYQCWIAEQLDLSAVEQRKEVLRLEKELAASLANRGSKEAQALDP